MQLPSLVLTGLIGVAIAMPLPLLAWWIATRKPRGRSALILAIVGASLLSGVVFTALFLSFVEDTGQHSMGAGLARFAYGFGFPLCQLVASALILALAMRRSSSC